MKYEATFVGRLKGAIGIGYRHTVKVEAPDEEAARLKLYETHDHIHGLVLTQLPRMDLVEKVRKRIAAGEYHMDTLEGDLAINLTTDKLIDELLREETE